MDKNVRFWSFALLLSGIVTCTAGIMFVTVHKIPLVGFLLMSFSISLLLGAFIACSKARRARKIDEDDPEMAFPDKRLRFSDTFHDLTLLTSPPNGEHHFTGNGSLATKSCWLQPIPETTKTPITADKKPCEEHVWRVSVNTKLPPIDGRSRSVSPSPVSKEHLPSYFTIKSYQPRRRSVPTLITAS